MSAFQSDRGGFDVSDLADEVHVWWAETLEHQDPKQTSLFEGWLSSDELRRYRCYRQPPDASSFLIAHAMLRHTLSRYVDVEPAQWCFRTGEYGRPELSGRFEEFGLRFNLSHTAGLVACVVCDGIDAGVDVEERGRAKDPLKLATHAFSEHEHHELATLSPGDMETRFYEIWTLKEAYIKARGMGLALPLDKFAFTFLSGGRIALELEPAFADEAHHWQFSLWRPTKNHQGAVALRRGPGKDRTLVFRRGLGRDDPEFVSMRP